MGDSSSCWLLSIGFLAVSSFSARSPTSFSAPPLPGHSLAPPPPPPPHLASLRLSGISLSSSSPRASATCICHSHVSILGLYPSHFIHDHIAMGAGACFTWINLRSVTQWQPFQLPQAVGTLFKQSKSYLFVN